MRSTRNSLAGVLAVALTGAVTHVAANNSWSGYHWARSTSSFDLTIINSTTAEWDGYVSAAIGDWSQSQKLNMLENHNGDTSNETRLQCQGGSGTVRICNLAYGNTGWLGIAGISVDANGHIFSGYTKLNDTYFADPAYDNFEWRQSIACQELGHDVGLSHQDENFSNQPLYSCMDYQNPPYAYPGAHDYDELASVYAHTDSYESYASTSSASDSTGSGCTTSRGNGCNSGRTRSSTSTGWGVSIGRHGNHETFVRVDGDGITHLTDVHWLEGHGRNDGHGHR